MEPETLAEARIFVSKAGGLRKAARRLHVSAGTLGDIVNGRTEHVGKEAENRVRIALGLEPVFYFEVPACPDCGNVHTGRCRGRHVELRPVDRKPVSRVVDMRLADLRSAIRNRVEV